MVNSVSTFSIGMSRLSLYDKTECNKRTGFVHHTINLFFPEFRKSQLDLSKTTRRYLELKTETEIKHISGEILLH